MATVFRAPLYPTDLFTHPVLATTPTHDNIAGQGLLSSSASSSNSCIKTEELEDNVPTRV